MIGHYEFHTILYTGCPKINCLFLNVNNFETKIRIANPDIHIDRGDL